MPSISHGLWIRRLLSTLALLAVLWLVLAARSGAFVATDAAAVVAGDFTADGFSPRKKLASLPSGQVAYLDEGKGPPLVLLHGCPFSAYEWNAVIPALSSRFRVIVPDLRGLGDTPVSLSDDYRLPTDAVMVGELLDLLGIQTAAFVAHDHGGATLQLLMAAQPGRIERAVLTNVEAFDAWPSEPERIYLELIVHPLTSPLMFQALQFESVRRKVFSVAVHDVAVLTPAVLTGWTAPHVASGPRWQRLRRFYRWQLDPVHQRVTMDVVPALRRFARPVLLIWGSQDTNFGLPIAARLARELPGTRGIVVLDRSGHMPMQEQPREYAEAVLDFLADDEVAASAVAALNDARSQP